MGWFSPAVARAGAEPDSPCATTAVVPHTEPKQKMARHRPSLTADRVWEKQQDFVSKIALIWVSTKLIVRRDKKTIYDLGASITGTFVSLSACFTLETNQASVIPEMNPAKWHSHETALDVGTIPRTMPPYPKMQTMDKSTVQIFRPKKASDASD